MIDWPKWAYVQLPVIDRVFLALDEQILEIMHAARLAHIKAIPAITN